MHHEKIQRQALIGLCQRKFHKNSIETNTVHRDQLLQKLILFAYVRWLFKSVPLFKVLTSRTVYVKYCFRRPVLDRDHLA